MEARTSSSIHTSSINSSTRKQLLLLVALGVLAGNSLLGFYYFQRRPQITINDTIHTVQTLLANDKTLSATSGRLYQIQATRSVDPKQLIFQTDRSTHKTTTSDDENDDNNDAGDHKHRWPTGSFWNLPPNNQGCQNWGVTTTIFPVTKAAADVARLPNWCLVVAGDRKGPESYNVTGGSVIFLSQERQQELQQTLAFVAHTPWNRFARKNIAYLYAIANGAQFIWDFDDDNALLPGETLQRFTDQKKNTPTVGVWQVDTVNHTECHSFNPYEFFPSSAPSIWPRGYPLEDIKRKECHLAPYYCQVEVSRDDIGIYQSLAQHDPDVDAIFRLTRDLPVHFYNGAAPEKPPKQNTLPVEVLVPPPNTLSPMNAQAALFHRSAMWSLFLPTTVHGRVSDIWRSYFTQALAKPHGMLVSFMGPVVTQVRNAHTYLADLNAEIPLYEQAGPLIAYLQHDWEYPDDSSFEGAMERLYADLYERRIIEWNDVRLVQLWLSTLRSIGYTFPSIDNANNNKTVLSACTNGKTWRKEMTEPRYDNVVLVGQFNFNTDANYVLHWVRRWSILFSHIQVRGPFNSTNIASLRENGVNVFWGDNDAGYFSPMKNLAETLQMYANDERIRGVLLSHDDLLFNITHLDSLGFPSTTDILSQAFPSVVERPYLEFTNDYKYRLFGRPELHNVTDFRFGGKGKGANLKPWRWWKHCLPGFANGTSLDRRGATFAGNNGSVAMYANSVGDFAYIPTSYAKPFAEMADWLVDNQVFLECGMPTLIGHLKEKHNATTTFVHYCTSFDSDRKDYTAWVPGCARGEIQKGNNYYPQPIKPLPPYGLYHPVKLSIHGTSVWDTFFELVNPPKA